VPRPYRLAAVARVLIPGIVRRVTASKQAGVLTTRTGPDEAEEG
jgi:hypothetical protein